MADGKIDDVLFECRWPANKEGGTLDSLERLFECALVESSLGLSRTVRHTGTDVLKSAIAVMRCRWQEKFEDGLSSSALTYRLLLEEDMQREVPVSRPLLQLLRQEKMCPRMQTQDQMNSRHLVVIPQKLIEKTDERGESCPSGHGE